MTVGNAILNLVEQLLQEREKVVRLEISNGQRLDDEEQLNKD